MKRIFIILCTLFSVWCMTNAEDADVHRLGNYNVRYVAKNGDTGGKLWTSRKTRVLNLITDYDYDIISLNEVTGSNKDETGATVNQKQDIETYMSSHGYNTIAYEREDRQYSWNMVCYKKDKYTCLEHSSFWISATPFKVSFGWDCGTENNIYRRVIVAHMKVNATGEEFYFFGTHVNYGLYSSGIDGARVVSRLCKQYAGNLPMMLAGDINMNRENHTDAYRGWMYCFREAKLTAQENICLPASNPAVSFTTNNWCRPGTSGCSGSEFDHIFYSKMECLQNIVITETYGEDQTPSDHFAVMARVRLMRNHPTHYVAADEASLQAAVAQAEPLDTIYLPTGDFTLSQPISPDRSLCFIGGYNVIKKNVSGTTKLIMTQADKPAFSLPKWYSLEVQNCVFDGYNNTSIDGGGAILCNGSELKLRNCTFMNNHSSTTAGAVQAGADVVDIQDCSFVGNQAATNGGAISAPARSLFRFFDNLVERNVAVSGSGVAVISCEYANVQNSSFIANDATKHGALYFLKNDAVKSINLLNCSFLNNQVTAGTGLSTVTKLYGGAGVCVALNSTSQMFNMGHCSLLGNKISFAGTSNFNGAALNVFSGKVNLRNNIICGNIRTMNAAMVYADTDVSTATVQSNIKNVYTSDLSSPQTDFLTLFGGKITNDYYTVFVTSQHTYQLKTTKAGTLDLACLTTNQRLLESVFLYDLNEDGQLNGYVSLDQLHQTRPQTSACIGAVEYTGKTEPEDTDLNETIWTGHTTDAVKTIRNGRLYIINNNHIYNAMGALIL